MVRVLIVDDDDGVVQTLTSLMRDEGLEAAGATNPNDVERLARQIMPDVILVDLMLNGGWCGFEIAEALRESNFPDTPMIAMTGSPYQAELARETDLFAAVAEKPFDADDILLAVTEAMARTLRPTTAG